MKDDYLQKSRKSDLTNELKKLFERRCPQSLPATVQEQMMTNDFMGCAHKVPTNKANLKTFFEPLWSTFMQLFKDSTQIDTI